MGYEKLEFANIEDVMLGANEKKYKQNPYSFGYIEKAIIFYNDNTTSVIEFTDASDAKDFCKTMKKNGVNLDNKVYKTNSKSWKVAYKEAKSDKEDSKVRNALATAGLIAGIGVIAATSGAIGYKLNNGNDAKTIENTDDTDINNTKGFGIYAYDLSDFTDMDQYADEIPESLQKENAFNYLNILRNFNNEIELTDGEKQLGGLTIEQLIAIDAYSNSNLYTKEDYVKNFGLYDFSNVANDFQQGAITTGAYLSTGQVDGKILADVFKDETVKNFYLKALDYHDKILTSKDSKEQKEAVKNFEEYMNSVAVDQATESYIDYDLHPGMAFATTVIVNSLNYNNVKLSSQLISNTIVIGDEEHQSKIDSICSDANQKLDDAMDLINDMSGIITDNENIKIYNSNEIKKASDENRAPVLMSLRYEELDTLLTEKLCDQKQVNILINNELSKENKLVTVEDQEKINANAIEISRFLQNNGSNYENLETAKLAAKLQKKGDIATVTEKGVKITNKKDKEDLYKKNPEGVKKAKEEENKNKGTKSYETDDDKKKTDDEINKDVEDTTKEGTELVNKVVAYYEKHGNVSGIPSELKNAYQKLGKEIFEVAKKTGVSKWEVNNKKTTGGDIIFDDDNKDVENPEHEVIEPDTPIPDPEPEQPAPEPEQPAPEPEQPSPTPGDDIIYFPGFEDVEIGDVSDEETVDTNITEAEIDAYINSLEGQQFLQDLLVSNENEVNNGLTR